MLADFTMLRIGARQLTLIHCLHLAGSLRCRNRLSWVQSCVLVSYHLGSRLLNRFGHSFVSGEGQFFVFRDQLAHKFLMEGRDIKPQWCNLVQVCMGTEP